jgi:CHAT domain
MNGSPETEETEDELFAKAVAAYQAGDLAKARGLFKLVVERDGEHRQEAARYLALIARRFEPITRGGPFGVAPPPPPLEGAAPEAAADASQEVRRTPHMDIAPSPPVAPDTWLKVSVYTDTEGFREGESGEGVVLRGGAETFEVDVWLVVGAPFEVEGSAMKKLTITRSQDLSTPAQFLVIRKASAEPEPETALFSAMFAYNGRPCGRVSRAVPVTAQARVPEASDETVPESGIHIDAEATGPDLSVRIVRSGTDERLFDCLVQTPLLPYYQKGKNEPWRLSSLASDLVREKMAMFTAKTGDNFVRTAALRSAGLEFFEASPQIFQKVFWELIDAGTPPKTISIVTEEPSIPWELMVPTRDGGADEREEPLGVELLVSRWSSRSHVLPPQRVPLQDAYVVAPRDSRLANAEEEVAMVVRQFPGKRIDPAGMRELDTSLGEQGRTLLHFICHGKSGTAGSQILVLEQRQELNASLLRAMPGVKKAFKAGKPLVFLNACEVGRQEPALVGAGGFAEIFMTLGASGVIAPLWSVKDSVAHEIAETFYKRVAEEPETPFSEILRDLRKKSYAAEGGEDTYAAYCFYGDPLARRAGP